MKTLELKDERGKSLPKSFTKTLGKLVDANKIRAEYEVTDPRNKRTNPFSGAPASLCDLAAELHDWIVSVNPIGGKLTRVDWDNARYTFHVCWPEAYYTLID